MILDLLENGNPSRLALAVSGGGPKLTYDQLRAQVNRLVDELRQAGLGRDDRIAMALPNGIEMIVSFLASSTVGTAAPLNPAYTREEFKFYLEDTSARALILPPKDAEEARAAAGNDVMIIEADLDGEGCVQFSSAHKPRNVRITNSPNSEDFALILHTSGTTSRPKRVPLSHANLMTSARNVADTYKLTPEDVSLCVLPLFHVQGLVALKLETIFTEGTGAVSPNLIPL